MRSFIVMRRKRYVAVTTIMRRILLRGRAQGFPFCGRGLSGGIRLDRSGEPFCAGMRGRGIIFFGVESSIRDTRIGYVTIIIRDTRIVKGDLHLDHKLFSTRVKLLIKSKGMNQKEFAKEIDIPYTTINSYLTKHRDIPVDIVILLADHFGVSTDYLLGRSNDSTSR